MRDRTAQTEPLTTGQQIVAWWETGTSVSEPADLAERIDAALAAERESCATAIRVLQRDDNGWDQDTVAACLNQISNLSD